MSIELSNISNQLRKRIIKTSASSGIPHLGSCLSCIDILIYLYWKVLNINPLSPTDKSRDRFVLSKGHGAPALLQVLAEKGFFEMDLLDEFGKPGSYFHEHPPKPGLIPGIEAATGSLGHGLPMALGMAIAEKVKKLEFNTYVMLSDGECNEGSIWEAAMMASAQNIRKLTVIIDYNKWQATGRSKEILSLEPLKEKWESFGWSVQEISGHNFEEIEFSLKESKKQNKPSAIIAHTIKGKGVSFMEDDNNWHYRIPNEKELKEALLELSES
jgi:transketolase